MHSSPDKARKINTAMVIPQTNVAKRGVHTRKTLLFRSFCSFFVRIASSYEGGGEAGGEERVDDEAGANEFSVFVSDSPLEQVEA